MTIGEVLHKASRTVSWYVRGVLGESDYDAYVAHLRKHHPDQPLPTVKQYWRERWDYEEKHPSARCC